MFIHAGLLHLLFNMASLWVLGRIIESHWGNLRFLIYYLLMGITAYMVTPDRPVIGASGAIFGLLASVAICFPDGKFELLFSFSISTRVFAIIYAQIELSLLILRIPKDHISHGTHLAGMASGLIISLLHENWHKMGKIKKPKNINQG